MTILPILREAIRGGHTTFPHSPSVEMGIPPPYVGELIPECQQQRDNDFDGSNGDGGGRRGLILKPKAGQALLFYNRLPTGELDPTSEHAGCSVQEGVKYAANRFTWDVDRVWAWRFQMKAEELYNGGGDGGE